MSDDVDDPYHLTDLTAIREMDKEIMDLSAKALQKHIEHTLATNNLIPEGKKGAIIAVGNLEGVQVAMALKTGNGWTVDLLGEYKWDGDKSAEVVVTKTW